MGFLNMNHHFKHNTCSVADGTGLKVSFYGQLNSCRPSGPFIQVLHCLSLELLL